MRSVTKIKHEAYMIQLEIKKSVPGPKRKKLREKFIRVYYLAKMFEYIESEKCTNNETRLTVVPTSDS